jgi:hypothetical protein
MGTPTAETEPLQPMDDRSPAPLSRWRQWLHFSEEGDTSQKPKARTYPWYLVIWLTGVDYFSTLGYQPGIALLAAGAISPLATAVLVLVTLFGALPVYSQVAGRSYVGQGSIAMLENILPGWWGRILVLVLLGFAATDFVITMTLSAADAATHAVENPFLHPFLHNARVGVTICLLALLALVFLIGFKEAIQLATAVCVPYLILNVIVLGRTAVEVLSHPVHEQHWRMALSAYGDWHHVVLASALVFPQLALGLSGFETGVSVMPLIRGNADDKDPPAGRIQNTRRLLVAAACIMSVLLLVSSYVSVALVPEAAFKAGGPANGRVIAYLAHQYLGNVFGSVYDLSTILILWFGGASAMAGLLHLVPRYLPRVGMAPQWVAYGRPLVLVLFGCNLVITFAFHANVDAQGGAYATGVLVLISSAAIASAITLFKEGAHWQSAGCWVIVLVFAYTTVQNIRERTDGILIASAFIGFILIVSAISRYIRSTEIRVEGHYFLDDSSAALWQEMVRARVNVVPVMALEPDLMERRRRQVQDCYRAEGPFAFVKVDLLDNRSEFLSPLEVSVTKDGDDYRVSVSQAVARANAIAYLSELLRPRAVFMKLTGQNPMRQSMRYLLLGEGEAGLIVYSVLQHYWEKHPSANRPHLFLMTD